jgi:hypothetical protein
MVILEDLAAVVLGSVAQAAREQAVKGSPVVTVMAEILA